MIIELSSFFNNPSLIEVGPIKIQYYAVSWLLSSYLMYLFLKSNEIIAEIGLSEEKVNDLVFLYGLVLWSNAVEAELATCSFMEQINWLAILFLFSMYGRED